MLSPELFAKIRYIDITTSRLVDSVFAGEYHSVFKGKGMEFDEVREYVPGDDVRDIDWNVTAKTGHPHTKRFIEERELTVFILIDVSGSEYFGSQEHSKAEIIAQICALLAFSAIKNNDRVGVLFFSDQVEKFILPKKGKRHVLRVIREILTFKPKHQGTSINAALRALNEILPKKSIVFLMSDFLTKDYETLLKITHKKHDVIAVVVEDSREIDFPNIGYIELEDVESKQRVILNSGNRRFRQKYLELNETRRRDRTKLFASIRMDHIEIRSDKSYTQSLIQFFKSRAKKVGRN